MANLNKRQFIIIIITIVVILYGAYTLIFAAKAQKVKKESNSEGKDSYISNIVGDIMKNSLTMSDTYIIGRSEAAWGKNPFWEKGSYKEWANRDDTKAKNDMAAKIVYSGYLDAGKKKMAVINGMEYSVGDSLENGYVLKKITAEMIAISNKNTGSELEIAIQE